MCNVYIHSSYVDSLLYMCIVGGIFYCICRICSYVYYALCICWVNQHLLKQFEDLDCQTPGNFPGQGWFFVSWNLIEEFAMENRHAWYGLGVNYLWNDHFPSPCLIVKENHLYISYISIISTSTRTMFLKVGVPLFTSLYYHEWHQHVACNMTINFDDRWVSPFWELPAFPPLDGQQRLGRCLHIPWIIRTNQLAMNQKAKPRPPGPWRICETWWHMVQKDTKNATLSMYGTSDWLSGYGMI